MNTAIDRAKAIVARMTPGPWRVKETLNDRTVMAEEELRIVTTSWHGRVRKHYPLKAESVANAAGIVFASALARVIIDPETVEKLARQLYEADPIYDSGETVEGFQVTPGGNLTWEQFLDQSAEFEGDPLFHGWNDKLAAHRADALAILNRICAMAEGEGK